MRESFTVRSEALPGVALRAAGAADCENLRAWKNANRQSFFHTDVINADQQQAWFRGYLDRSDDWMFLVYFEDRWDDPVGCMGFRRESDPVVQADVYNVILGNRQFQGRGVMAAALRLMCSFARLTVGPRVVARVLTSNPALGWYLKQGFEVVSQEDTHYFIQLSEARFQAVSPIATERKETER